MDYIKNRENPEKVRDNANGGAESPDRFFSENPNPIIRAEKGGTIVYANSAASPLLESWGVREGDKLPLKIGTGVKNAIIRKQPEELELEAGDRVYLLTCYPLAGEDSADLYGFDISSRKRAEEAVKIQPLPSGELPEKGVQEVEKTFTDKFQFLETMISKIPVAVFYKDREGRYLGCNELFAKQIIGLPEEKIIGRKLHELETSLSPELVREYQRLNAELLKKGGKHVFETEIICSDGVLRTFLATRAVFHDEKGETAVLAGVLLDISGFKKTEITLRNNLNLFETLLDAIPAPIFYKNMDGIYLGCNDLFARKVAGVPKEKIINRNIYEMEHDIPKDLIPIYEEYDRKLLREGKPQSYVAKGMCANGELREFQFNKSFYNDASGKKLGIIVVMQDITELKQARDTLKTSEERYRIVAEQTGQIIFDYNVETKDIDWAGPIPELTGYAVEEFRKFDRNVWQEHIHPDDRKRAVKTVVGSLDSGNKFFLEYRFRKKDGSFFYAEESGIFLTNKDGTPFRILGVIKDITESKLALKKLEKSEERFRTFMEKFRGIAFQLNGDFNPIFMHGSVEELTGYSTDDFLSRKMKLEQTVYPEDLPGVTEVMELISKTPNFLVEHEFRLRRRDGKIRWVHVIVQNITDNAGNFQYFQGTLYDINERKIAEEALEQIEVVRKKEIHHRIKNNLQVISSLLGLQSDNFTNPKVVEAFRESQNRVISMSLIHEELYKSRDMETIDFATYLRELSSDLLRSYSVGNSDIRLSLDLDDVSLGIDSSIPLGIIVNELLSNALKHAFPEGRKGEIRIKLSGLSEDKENIPEPDSSIGEKNKYFTLLVADNGVGFPEDIDFRSTTSLGMQLVNTLVDQINGSITLKRGAGTEFIIQFPE